MDCQKCGARSLYFDVNNFICLNCAIEGRFSDLKKNIQQNDDKDDKEKEYA